MAETVSWLANGAIAELILDRPPVNALTVNEYRKLSDVLRQITLSNAHVTLVRATGTVFSAGADTNRLKNDSPDQAMARRAALRQMLDDLYYFSLPLVVAVQGPAVGAGLMLAACSDIIVASDNAFFALPEIDVGVVGGARHLARILPIGTVHAMALTGCRLSAAEMYRLGAIQSLVSADNVQQEARRWATTIAAKPAPLLRRWKHALIFEEGRTVTEGLRWEQEISEYGNLGDQYEV